MLILANIAGLLAMVVLCAGLCSLGCAAVRLLLSLALSGLEARAEPPEDPAAAIDRLIGRVDQSLDLLNGVHANGK